MTNLSGSSATDVNSGYEPEEGWVIPPKKLTPAEAFGARVEAALNHAKLTPTKAHKILVNQYQLRVSLQSIYDAKNGIVTRSRITPELAKITGVSQDWLLTGKGHMLDHLGRRDIKFNELRQYASGIIPEGRKDLKQLTHKFLDRIYYNPFTEQEAEILSAIIDRLQPPKAE